MIDPEKVAAMVAGMMVAWNAKSPEAVAAFYEDIATFTINRGEPWKGRAGIAEMCAGFHSDVPDLDLKCDAFRCADDHAIYFWTFTGHHATTGAPLDVAGWEEMELGEDMKIKSSLGWYDAADYARQVEGA